MKQLNSVILRGIIGNARIQNIGDTQMARFSVATDHAYKNRPAPLSFVKLPLST